MRKHLIPLTVGLLLLGGALYADFAQSVGIAAVTIIVAVVVMLAIDYGFWA